MTTGSARIADNIINGNRADAATAINVAANPANMTVLVLYHLIYEHRQAPDRAIETMRSLTNRNEFWEEPA